MCTEEIGTKIPGTFNGDPFACVPRTVEAEVIFDVLLVRPDCRRCRGGSKGIR